MRFFSDQLRAVYGAWRKIFSFSYQNFIKPLHLVASLNMKKAPSIDDKQKLRELEFSKLTPLLNNECKHNAHSIEPQIRNDKA